ncbi:MAG: phage tail tape measure protein [Halobacteriota archaeon]
MSVDITSLSIRVESSGVREASSALGGLSTSAANADRRILKLIETTEKFNKANLASLGAMNAFEAQFKKQKTLMDSFHTSSMGAAASTKDLATAMALLAVSMNNLNATQQKATVTQSKHNQGMRDAHGLARGLSGSLGALWMTYGSLAGMAIGVAIGASLKGVVTVGKDVEHTLETLRVKGGETVESANKMREAIYSIGQGVYGPQEVVRALETLVLAGLNATQAMQALRPALNLATAGGTDIKTAAEGLVTIGTAVGATAEHYTVLADGITTAANVSLASVESITNTVKRASVVNKLYGASFEDILIQASALANLGIKDSAAGTAITNFYSDMQGKSEKAKKALKDLGVEFTDTTGRAKPIVQMMKEFNAGLNQFTEKKQTQLTMDIFGERAKRDVVAITDMIKTAGTEAGKTTTKLEELAGKISNMAGASSIVAAQIALTSENQIKSMNNTLKVTLAKTFREMEPMLNVFTSKMKEAFNSPQFASALTTIAHGVGALTVGLVNNIGPLTVFIAGIMSFKVAMMGMSIATALTTPLMAAATAFGVTATAASGATVATGLFGTAIRALPFIGLAAGIATVIGALIMYKFHAAGARNSTIETAEAYRTNYLDALKTEAEQITKTTDGLAAGLPVMEAQTKAIKEQALEKTRLNNVNAIGAAQDDLNKEKAAITKAYGAEYLKMAEKNGKLPESIKALTAELKKQKDASVEFERQAGQYANTIISGSEKVRQAYLKEQAAAREAARLAAGGNGGADGPSKSALNDAYTSAMLNQQNEIKDAKKDLARFEEEENLRHKAGQISKLEVLENVGAKQVEIYARTQAALKAQMAVAKGPDKERVSGAMEQAEDDFKSKQTNNALQKEIEYTNAVKLGVKLRIAELEKEHSYGVAAQERWAEANNTIFKELKKNSDKYGGAYTDTYNRMLAAQKAAIAEGFNREDVRKFNNEVEGVHNTLKAVQTATEGQGMGAMFEAAVAASDVYADKIAGIREQMAGLTDEKSIVEAQARLNNLAETQRKMWVGVGDSISKSLENAFGKGGKAAGDLMKVAVNYKNLDDKTAGARIKAYGDAAGAAKGFFNEGTKGYKILEGAEKAFRMVEIAGMAHSLAMSLSTDYAKAMGKAPAVIMEFMSQMGPWGAAAAGVAIAGVLGGAFGGGGSVDMTSKRQDSAGRGSVLGDSDAKSESIVNSLSTLEKNSGLGLVQSNTMIGHMKTVADGISNLSAMIVRASGLKGDFGVAASTPSFFKTLFGASKTSVTDSGVTAGAKSFGQVQQSGMSVSSYADVEKSKWWGLSKSNSTQTKALGDEVNNQFKLVITGMGDAISSAANLLGIGGDAFNEKLKGFVVDIGTISTEGLSGAEIEEQFQAVFSKLGDDMAKYGIGGMEKYQKVGEGYLETLSRVANNMMQVKDVFAVMGQSLMGVGVSAVEASESLISAAGGLEKLTSGTKYFVDNFLTEAERMAPITQSVTERLKELGVSELNTVELYKKKVLALNLANAEDQKLYAALIELAPAFKEVSDYATKAKDSNDIANKQRELDIRLMEAMGNTLGATNARREDELAALNKLSPALAATQQAIYDIEDAMKASSTAKTNLETAYKRESTELQGVIDKFKKFSETLKKFKNDLLIGELSTLSPEQKYLKMKQDFNSTSALAATGDEDALSKLQEVSQGFLDASRGYNASTEDYAKDFNLVQKALSSGVKAADIEVNIAQSQLTIMKSQYEKLVGIDSTLMSFQTALMNYLNTSGGNAANTVGNAYKASLGRAPDKEGLDFWTGKLNSGVPLADIENAMNSSPEAKIRGIYKDMLGREPDISGMQFWVDKFNKGISLSSIKKAIAESSEATGSHYNGLDEVPFDGYTARMHKGERIQTAKAANDSDKNSAALVELTKELITKIDGMQADTSASVIQRGAIAEQTAEQMDALVRKMEDVKRAVKAA